MEEVTADGFSIMACCILLNFCFEQRFSSKNRFFDAYLV
jgi:hypothetical protein